MMVGVLPMYLYLRDKKKTHSLVRYLPYTASWTWDLRCDTLHYWKDTSWRHGLKIILCISIKTCIAATDQYLYDCCPTVPVYSLVKSKKDDWLALALRLALTILYHYARKISTRNLICWMDPNRMVCRLRIFMGQHRVYCVLYWY